VASTEVSGSDRQTLGAIARTIKGHYAGQALLSPLRGWTAEAAVPT